MNSWKTVCHFFICSFNNNDNLLNGKRMEERRISFTEKSLGDLTQGIDHFYDGNSQSPPVFKFFLNSGPIGHLCLDVT